MRKCAETIVLDYPRVVPDRADRAWLDVFQSNWSQLYITAVLITGTIEAAEAAIEDSFDMIDFAAPADERVAQRAVAVAATWRTPDRCGHCGANLPLSIELIAVTRLPRNVRCCFVLRRLVGFTNEETGKILAMTSAEVAKYTRDASVRLAQGIPYAISN